MIVKKFLNKLIGEIKQKKNKINLNFTNNELKEKFKEFNIVQSFENKNLEINFSKKESINNLILKKIKKNILNVKN